MERSIHGDWPWLLGLFFAAVLTFEPALTNTYTFDDIYQAQTLQPPQDWGGWARAAATPWWPPDRQKNLWRPVTRLSILTQKALTGQAAWPLYGFNILLHAGVCLLLFLLARRLGLASLAAGLGALLFAVHWVHAEAVHQIVGRAELLAAFWMLAGLLLWIRLGARCWASWLAQPLVFALALGSKEHALIYPFLIFLIEFRALRTAPSALEKSGPPGPVGPLNPQSAWLLVLLVGVLGLFFAAKAAVTGGVIESPASVPYHENPLAAMSPAQRVPAALGIFGYAASRLLWPMGLAPDYSAMALPLERGWGWGWAGVGLGVLAATLALALRSALRRRRGWALAAAALGSYALISNGPFTIGVALAPRLWYWPSAPVCLGLGWLLAGLAGRIPEPRRRGGTILLVSALWLIPMSVTGRYGMAWNSPLNFAGATLRCFPDSWRARTELARLNFEGRDFAGGYENAKAAVRIFPRLAYGWAWLGSCAMFLPGHQAEAGPAFAKALELDPALYEVHHHWAGLLLMQGRRADAIRELEEYLKAPAIGDREKVRQQVESLKAGGKS